MVSSSAQQQVPEGYKQTEVGLIPDDWEVKPLGQLVQSVEYGSSAKSNESGTVPVLRMGNLQSGKIDWNGLVYTSDTAEISKYKLYKDDVLFNRTNTVDLVGKTSIYKGEYPAIFAGYLIRINRIEDQLDADYLNYTLNSYHSKKYSKFILSVAVSQANINGQKLKTYPIPTPPNKAEQTAIADALSDVDGLIGSLEKLIAKKRAIKTAAMQQLLTGKKRLPPFDQTHTGYKQTDLGEIPNDWEIRNIESIASKVGSGKTPKGGSTVYINHGRPLVRSQNVGWGKLLLDDVAYISEEVHETFLGSELREGDVLLNITGASIGRCATANNELVGGNVNQHVCIIRVDQKQVDSRIIASLILSTEGQNQIDSFQAGGNREGLNFTQVKALQFALPESKEEQTAITNVLSDMDTELEALEQRLNKTQQLKQGMMQELLTGRTRLV